MQIEAYYIPGSARGHTATHMPIAAYDYDIHRILDWTLREGALREALVDHAVKRAEQEQVIPDGFLGWGQVVIKSCLHADFTVTVFVFIEKDQEKGETNENL